MSDTERTEPAQTDMHLAYAEASILLLESLILTLLQRQVLSLDELRSTVEAAVDTKKEYVTAGIHPQISLLATGVLQRIDNSVAAGARRTGRGHEAK
jgi:hypothetical protein